MSKNFSYLQSSAKDLQRAFVAVLAQKKKVIEAVVALPSRDRNFQNVVVPLEISNGPLTDLACLLSFLSNVHTSAKLRATCMKLYVDLANDTRALYRNEALYQAFQDVAAKKEKLSDGERKLLHEMLVEEKLLGLELPPAERAQLAQMQEELTSLEQEYSNAINLWRDAITVKPEETEGLSKNFLSQLKKDSKGNYIVTIDYPQWMPFMQFAKHAGKRKELAQVALKRGGKANLERLFRMLQLRGRIAKLLGYKNHTAMKLELRMMKRDTNAVKFVKETATKVRPKALKYLKKLEALKKLDFEPNAKLDYYDLTYYAAQYFEKEHRVDLEKIRTFFPITRVTKGILKIYEQILGLKFTQKKDSHLWHATVQMYEVQDVATKKTIGHFFLDLHPREGKYTHAAVMPLEYARQEGGTWVLPAGSVVANFTAPTKDNPGYLTHREMTTYFHEFGHMMHLILSKAPNISHAATNVAWDFVEAPSQMLEFWMWDKNILKSLAKIPKGQEKDFDILIRNLLASEKVGSAYFVLNQLIFALTDLNLHTKDWANVEAVRKEFSKVKYELLGIPEYEKQMFLAGFGHMVGYDGGYYGYMWSKTIASDLFTVFEKLGIDSRVAGKRYREEILEPGGTADPSELIERFLQRKLNTNALIERVE